MKRLLHLLLATVLFAAGASHAAAEDPPENGVAGTSFVVVDAFKANHWGSTEESGAIVVTGIVEGESESRTILFGVSHLSSCERMLMLSMERPGRYVVSLVRMGEHAGQRSLTCKLKRTP
jgi:hypothetical protein